MAGGAKGTSAARAGGSAGRWVEQAVRKLKDPEVQRLIREHAPVVVDRAQRWWAERPSRDGRSVAERVQQLGGRFGQRGLERRAANVRGAVASLSADSPELATSLRPVAKSLDDVDQLLIVSAALPFARRKKAHMKIDDVLDDLETGLFDSMLRGAGTEDQAGPDR